MGVQAIDQNIFPEVLGKTKVFYCPRSREKLLDLLFALPLNNFYYLIIIFLDRLKKLLFSISKYCLTILTNNTNDLFHNKHEDS